MTTSLLTPMPVEVERGERDEKGYRTYYLVWVVKSDTGLDGPANVLRTPGLPVPGSTWNVGGDVDPYVWCRMYAEVTPIKRDKPGEKARYWRVKQKFSNTPYQNSNDNNEYTCSGQDQQNPLLQPPRYYGSSENDKEEGIYDKDGKKILSSSFEPLRGPQNEWDKNKSIVNIEMNVPILNLDLLESMVNHVNSVPIWGQPKRHVKFDTYSWERKYWGSCLRYFTWKLKFSILRRKNKAGEVISGWDRELLDEGTKCLRGDWDRDTGSPTYRKWKVDPDIAALPDYKDKPFFYDRFKDWQGNLAKCVLTDGVPIDDDTEPGVIFVKYYPEANFYNLGVPSSLE